MFKRGDSVRVSVRSQSWPYVKQAEGVVTKVVGDDIYMKVGKITLMRPSDEVKLVK